MISLSVNVQKLTALSYISSLKVLENFGATVIDTHTIEIDQKKYSVWKNITLSEVVYTLERKSIFGRKEKILKFNILEHKKEGIVISIEGDASLLSSFNEKKFMEDLLALDAEKITSSKTLMSLRIKREEVTNIINLALGKSVNSTLLVWFSSENKYVRMKIKNGELIERIGDFSSLGENVDVLIKQLAIT